MNILVIGLGSMGRRRIRLIKENFACHNIFGADFARERCEKAAEEFGIKTFLSADEAFKSESIDCAFVSTSPASHCKIIPGCVANKAHVFTEINLVSDGYDEMLALAKENGVKLFLSSTLNYRKEFIKFRELIKNSKKPAAYIYHVGQYLPDWHPWESYKSFFVAEKRTNAVREIMAIQLPWILKGAGKVTHFNVMRDKMTDLELDYADCALLQLRHESGVKGIICFDVVSRSAQTRLEIISEDAHVIWNGTPDSLFEFDAASGTMKNVSLYDNVVKKEGYSANIIENAYTDEIKAFFDYVEKDKPPVYTFEDDRETLRLIDEIERN